jgi:hypothetical protein
MSVLGIDIAKRVFHAVGMDERGKIVWRKRLSRHDLIPSEWNYPQPGGTRPVFCTPMKGTNSPIGIADAREGVRTPQLLEAPIL